MNQSQKFERTVLNRLLFSLALLFLVRIGTFLPIPGVNHNDIAFYIQRHSTIRDLVSTFSSSETFVIGLFTLNIFPYINATIIVQLLVTFSKKLANLQKDGDFEGRRSISKLTRNIALFLTVVQSVGVTLYLKQILFDWSYFLALDIILWLTTGAMVVLWFSEIITESGLGNGASLLIYTSIVSNLPNLIKKTIFLNNETSEFSVFVNGLCITVLILVSLYGIVFLQEGSRKLPLRSGKRLAQTSLGRRVRNTLYLPLRFNQAGVMPIILATGLLVIPNYLLNIGIFPELYFLTSFKPIYWVSYFALVIISSSFYSRVVLKPKDLSDELRKMSVTIPKVRPGRQTTFYLKRVITRLTVIGATFLAILTVLPNFIESTLNLSGLNGLSTTSLLILAGVILDLTRELDNIYYSNIYNKRP